MCDNVKQVCLTDPVSFQDDKLFQKPNNGEYIAFQADFSGVIITIYCDKKGKHKVVFSGGSALLEAKKWNEEAEVKEVAVAPKGWLCKDNQIGSDEVGVGDFLLPVVVVAAFVRGKDLKELESFGVKDSPIPGVNPTSIWRRAPKENLSRF